MWHSWHSSLTLLDVITPLCVENNMIFTQMRKHKRPLYWEQYSIYTYAWKQKTFVSRTIQYLHSTKTAAVSVIPLYCQKPWFHQKHWSRGNFSQILIYSLLDKASYLNFWWFWGGWLWGVILIPSASNLVLKKSSPNRVKWNQFFVKKTYCILYLKINLLFVAMLSLSVMKKSWYH